MSEALHQPVVQGREEVEMSIESFKEYVSRSACKRAVLKRRYANQTDNVKI
jgi:hypothetical protein